MCQTDKWQRQGWWSQPRSSSLRRSCCTRSTLPASIGLRHTATQCRSWNQQGRHSQRSTNCKHWHRTTSTALVDTCFASATSSRHRNSSPRCSFHCTPRLPSPSCRHTGPPHKPCTTTRCPHCTFPCHTRSLSPVPTPTRTHTPPHTRHYTVQSSDRSTIRTDPVHTVHCTSTSSAQHWHRTDPGDTTSTLQILHHSTGRRDTAVLWASQIPRDSSSPRDSCRCTWTHSSLTCCRRCLQRTTPSTPPTSHQRRCRTPQADTACSRQRRQGCTAPPDTRTASATSRRHHSSSRRCNCHTSTPPRCCTALPHTCTDWPPATQWNSSSRRCS